MNDRAITERAETLPANDSTSLMEIISRAASDTTTDVTKLERLMSLYERVKSAGAEAAFNSAMKTAQSEMSRISTDANNPQTKSKYASYGKLDTVLRPIYTRHGFSVSFDTGDGAPPDCVRILAYVAHQDGHTRTYRADLPSDGKGAKGGDVMTKTHATGAAFTYGMRYLLKMIFNVAIGEDDKDGNQLGDLITEDQADELKKLVDDLAMEVDGADADYGAWLKVFLDHMKVETIGSIAAKNFGRAKDAIAATRKARTGK